ncbi:DUF2303 family protein [uncultured Roseobacter sp.]|uniref:DUF2303 family protein n=1 Tax=uncultured Roseobacter sp. TaxID=114847 RepID=UPI00262729B5|nr:DUF2303 family protein [uncultured Roseobacter sp.]
MAKKTSPNEQTNVKVAADPRAELDAAIDLERLSHPTIEGERGKRWAFVPDGYQLQDIGDKYRLPPHVVQSIRLDDRESLTSYVNRFSSSNSVIVANFDAMGIGAVLDWHPHNDMDEFGTSGANEHRATLKLLMSEEFKRWNEFEGTFHSQAEFAAFLEENAVDITDPEPGVMIEISRDLEANTQVGFKSSTRLENGDRKFTYETDTRVENDVVVPREFQLTIPLYNGEEPVELRAAFRFRPQADGLKLGFEWRRVEYQRRAYFQQIATQIADDTGLPVFFGDASCRELRTGTL